MRSIATRCIERTTLDLFCVDECPVIAGIIVAEANCDIVESGLITITLSEDQGNSSGSKSGEGSGIQERILEVLMFLIFPMIFPI